MAINVLIVAGPNTAGALALETLLEGRGDTATVVDDGTPVDTSAYDVLVFSDDCATAGSYLAETKGIVMLTRVEWAAYGLSSSASSGSGQTAIDVKNTAHSIAVASGFLSTGPFTVSSGSVDVDRINPGGMAAGGEQIADDSTTTDNRIVLFAFESGAALTSGNAAGRRVGWGHSLPDTWTTAGQTIFFACVDWAANVGAGGGNEYDVLAEQGSYTLTGQAANLIGGGGIAMEAGTYSLLGSEALRDIEIDAAQGSYALNGQVAALRSAFILGCDVGSYLLHGQSAQLAYSAAIATAVEEATRHFRRVAANRGFPFFGRY